MFEDLIFHVIVQLAVIIVVARIGARVFGLLGQPQVVGEILAGLMLGPSLLGRLSPELRDYVFPQNTSEIFHVLSEIGLILLMFLIGMDFDFSHLRHIGRTASSVALAGIALPFVLGSCAALAIHAQVAADINRVGFVLFVATALSITAIPILGRIMTELNIQRTRLGVLTITAAAVDDALGWILLAAVSAIVRGSFQWLDVALMLLATLAFIAIIWGIVRPPLVRLIERNAFCDGDELSLGGLAAVLTLMLVTAAITNRIGIFSIFGPFVLGAALSHERRFCEIVSNRLRHFVHVFFLPIFFTYTGLRTDIGFLNSVSLWLICGLLLLAAVVGKMAGCGLAARAGGLSWRESLCVAIMMNTRALMGLIAINVGRQLGVIPESVFCMLVIMALLTTVVTTPVLKCMLFSPAARP